LILIVTFPGLSVGRFELIIGLCRIKEVDKLVDKGGYTNKSDVIRDAIRKLVLEKQVSKL